MGAVSYAIKTSCHHQVKKPVESSLKNGVTWGDRLNGLNETKRHPHKRATAGGAKRMGKCRRKVMGEGSQMGPRQCRAV